MLKGMTIQQYAEILQFVQENHRFSLRFFPGEDDDLIKRRKKDYPKLPETHGYSLKYVDSCYDSRTNTIWRVCFRQGAEGWEFSTNMIVNNSPILDLSVETSLFDVCMKFLRGELGYANDFFISK